MPAPPPTPAPAQAPASPTVNLEQRMLLRCSAAFALVADRQQRAVDWALAYPPMGDRGREFFVISSARLMDEAQLSEDDLAQMLRTEAQALLDQQVLDEIMPVCLRFLDQSGL
ncbi:hypothetical protein GRI32_00895 [Altererythrobacter aestuarii]|uniref:Uncharacterized protein n=1 Tax=Alteraurantiacibacter aestuarii TaxID=650004 RepID=A0A844ZIA2_9SPHN|nr:hypothetical protein [Alteraurantiacibacter aestuarii]